jgi:hypothetical protein
VRIHGVVRIVNVLFVRSYFVLHVSSLERIGVAQSLHLISQQLRSPLTRCVCVCVGVWVLCVVYMYVCLSPCLGVSDRLLISVVVATVVWLPFFLLSFLPSFLPSFLLSSLSLSLLLLLSVYFFFSGQTGQALQWCLRERMIAKPHWLK